MLEVIMRTRSSRLLSRSVGLAALLPMLVLAVSGVRWNQFRCLMSGLVSEDRCCGSPGEGEPPAMPVVSAVDCCQHEVVVVSRPPSELPVAKVISAPPLGAALVAPVFAPEPAGFVVAAAVSPRPKSPLVLLKRSLLI
jgi:hypothetical protein